jgi:hypothetical protein
MNKRTKPYPIVETRSGIDWISATVMREDRGSDGWYAIAQSCVMAVHREGNLLENRSLLGFRGIKAGGCFAGENERRYYCQLSGEYADRFFEQLDRHHPHYSRLDLQVTVKYQHEQLEIAKEVYHDFISANTVLSEGRRRKGHLIVGSDGGDTVYLGAPSSRQRCRIYNKAKQSEREAYERCWRYEVVFRDELAREWAAIRRDKDSSVAWSCIETVGVWLEERGIAVPFRFSGDVEVLPKLRTLPTDVERKLEWLRTQVRPTIAYLQELGFERIILENLGIVQRPDDD